MSLAFRQVLGQNGLKGAVRSWIRGRPTPEPGAPRVAASARTSPNRDVRALVVDDLPMNLIIMSWQLNQFGIVAQLATDGAEAIDLTRRMRFDIILMDLEMPVLDGLRATTRIRRFEQSQALPPTPVVAYSCTTLDRTVLSTAGINGVLAKPCTVEELGDCMVRWCPGFAPSVTRGRAKPA